MKVDKKQIWGRMKKRTSQKTKGEDDDAQHHSHLITCTPCHVLVRKEKKQTNKLINRYRNVILIGEGVNIISATPMRAHAILSSAHKTLRSETEDLPLGTESRRQDLP